MQFIFVHGAMGSSQDNWFPWLRRELEIMGNEVIVPDFPTPHGQNVDLWLNTLKKKAPVIDEDTIFVAHSVGCAFVLSVLEQQKHKVKACFFVAGFVGPLGKDLDKLNKNLAERNFNWDKIKKNCGKFVLFASNNDPFVPVAKVEELKEKLGAGTELVMISNAGHFNASSGFLQFPLMFEKIVELMK